MEPFEQWAAHMNNTGEYLLALVCRKLADLPTLCSAMCVSQDARKAIHHKIVRPKLAYRIGRPRSVYDCRPQDLLRIAQQCFWLGSHAELISCLEICSTIILDWHNNQMPDIIARAAEDIICAALLHPRLKLQELHLDSIHYPGNIIQRLQHPKFLTSLTVSLPKHEAVNGPLCYSVGKLHHLKQLQLQCDNTEQPAAFGSLQLAGAAFSPLTQLTKLSLSIMTTSAAFQYLPQQLLWLEVIYLPTGASISHLTRLETLLLQNPNLHAAELLATVSSLSRLRAVGLTYSNFLSFAPEDHAAAWPAMPLLQSLHLWYSEPDRNSSWALVNPIGFCGTLYDDTAAAIQQCTGLTSLAVGFDHWDLHEVSVGQMLDPLSQLQNLALGVGQDDDKLCCWGVSATAVLPNTRHLTALVLDLPRISPLGLQQMLAARQLMVLELSCEQVDDHVLQIIAHNMVGLKHLGLGGRCQVSHASVEDLLSGTYLPHLKHIAVSPPRSNPFEPEAISNDNSTAPPTAPPVLAWGFEESDLTSVDSCDLAYASDSSNTLSSARRDVGGSALGWLERLQQARPEVEVSSYVTLRFSNAVYFGASAF